MCGGLGLGKSACWLPHTIAFLARCPSINVKRTVLALTLIGSASLVGCAADSGGGDDCLPGDAECNTRPVGDGKADGFDDKNDPAQMAQHLEYHLDRPLRAWAYVPR